MPKIPVYYSKLQAAHDVESFSPSALKPHLLVEDWKSDPNLKSKIVFRDVQPVTPKELHTIHDKKYVDRVLAGREKNGFGQFSSKATATSFLYTSGSIVTAAHQVLSKKLPVAVSPTSGFHHAAYDDGGAFCTFNGLALAAKSVQKWKLADRVLILDMDNHYGDGTQDILNRLQAKGISHITARKSYQTAKTAFRCLERTKFSDFDLVLYQAGADMHIKDPLGGLMTSPQLLARDYTVFERCKEAKTPVVWNLAGGYQKDADGTIAPVLDIHRTTLEECIRVYG